MKTKFKPTNLGRPRPRSNVKDASGKAEHNASSKKQKDEVKAVCDLPNGVGNEEVDDSVTGSSTPEHNLPGSPATVATPPATPTTDPMPPAMGTSPPVTMPPVSPATPASTETIPPNDITTPLNTVATPQRTTGIATLPNESATSASPLNGVCANTASHDLSPSSREGDGFGSTLALDVSLPLEIFATPSSAHEGEAGCKNGGSTADKASAVSSMPEKSTGETDKGTKHSCGDDKPRSEGAARSNGRIQPSKSTRKRGRKKACDQDKNQPSAGTASEESTSPVAQKSPGCKKSRTTKIREAPDKAVMTMRELIYYNPSANPMSTKFDDTKKPDRLSANPSPSPEQRSADQEKEEDEEEEEEERDETRIVPQLRIKDGKIVVDQQSLMVTTTTSKDTEILSDVVIEGPGHTTSSSYRCKYKATKWTKDETRTFFTALGKVGTDFTMMTLLLPKRTRKELKNKFKKEEKSNPHLISQALKVQQTRPIRT